MNIITTAVVLINADILADTIMNAGVISMRGSNLSFLIPSVSHCITPFSSSPTARIIKDNMVMVAALENPLIASSGVVMPNNSSATTTNSAILSIGKNSVTKRIIVIPIIIKTKSIGSSICDFLKDFYDCLVV